MMSTPRGGYRYHGEDRCTAVLLLLLLFSACTAGEQAVEVNFSDVVEMRGQQGGEQVVIGVANILSPAETVTYYEDLFEYLSEKLGREVRLVQRNTYTQMNELLRLGRVDVAFVCSRAYISGARQFGLQLLAVPVVYDEGPVYYSYIIVNRDSGINSFAELRGRSFAFSDPLSNSGELYPRYLLAEMNETPDTFFSHYFYTYSHDKSIEAVASGIVDGAAVDSLIWDYKNVTEPWITSRTRIIQVSPPFGIPPVVASPYSDKELVAKIKEVLLRMHEDAEGRRILEKLHIKRFIPPENVSYASIEEMVYVVEGKNVT
jgi:phosphonate transport system substrate-binding protein